MSLTLAICARCGKSFARSRGRSNRAVARGWKNAYCSRECYFQECAVRGHENWSRRRVKKVTKPGECAGCTKMALPNRRLCQECNEWRRAWQKEYQERHRRLGLCKSCKSPTNGYLYCDYHRARKRETTVRNNVRVKIEVFTAYGGCICACCGERELRFLTIDHINNDGAEHRRQLFGKSKQIGGSRLYRVLKKQGYPPGFQVLCFNCNITKGFFGECPHSAARRSEVQANSNLVESA